MEKLLFLVFIIFLNKLINCYNNHCFEFSCEECETQEYEKFTKCRNGFRLVDGTCPCSDPKCALCSIGLSGLNLCALCKNGYYIEDNECKCEINDCELCTENKCILCNIGYDYKNRKKKVKKKMNQIKFIVLMIIVISVIIHQVQVANNVKMDILIKKVNAKNYLQLMKTMNVLQILR